MYFPKDYLFKLSLLLTFCLNSLGCTIYSYVYLYYWYTYCAYTCKYITYIHSTTTFAITCNQACSALNEANLYFPSYSYSTTTGTTTRVQSTTAIFHTNKQRAYCQSASHAEIWTHRKRLKNRNDKGFKNIRPTCLLSCWLLLLGLTILCIKNV